MKVSPSMLLRLCSGLLIVFFIPVLILSLDPPAAYAGATIVVDRSDDLGGLPCDGTSNNCDLRSAITYANTHGTFNSIRFSDAITRVVLMSSLPTITSQGTWIAGMNATGTVTHPRIDGSGMSSGDAFTIDASDVTIANLIIVNVPPTATIASVTYAYSDIVVTGGKDARIVANHLGTLPDATNCTPPGVTRNAYAGVLVSSHVIGSSGAGNGSAYIWSNTIGCHNYPGIALVGASYTYVGQDPDGNPGANILGVLGSAYHVPNRVGIAVWATNTLTGNIGSKYNVIRGNQIYYNTYQGILLEGNGNNNVGSTYLNQVRGNYIAFNGNDGIHLDDGAFNNKIGGASTGDANYIYSNMRYGISINNSNTNGVLGNYVGVDPTGVSAFPNHTGGIDIESSSSNTIGAFVTLGPVEKKGNVISGNDGNGISVNNSSNNIIAGNFIGTNLTGTTTIPNSAAGVGIFGTSSLNVIGGTSEADLNLIGGNQTGIFLNGSGVTNNSVEYNWIGLNLSTLSSLGNSQDGIYLGGGTSGNVIGGAAVANNIGMNGYSGIHITGGAHDNLIDFNAVRQNLHYGIVLEGTGTTNNQITSTYVFSNSWDGIAQYPTATQNRWSHTSIWNNQGLGINLAPNGSPNGTPHPPFPVISSYNPATHTLIGKASPGATVEIYHIFPGAPDPTGNGEGGAFYGTATADGAGNWSVSNPSAPTCVFLTAFQTLAGQSSEFGHNYSSCPVYLPSIMR